MDFDEQGRLFVVEMPGYPLDTAPTGTRQAARGHGRRRPLRDQPRLRRRPGAADRRDALEEGRPRHGAARPPVPRGHRRRRTRRRPHRRHHRLRGHQPAAHGERAGLRPRQLDPPGARGADEGGHLQGRVRRPRHAAALAGPSAAAGARPTGAASGCVPTRGCSSRRPACRSSATASMRGAATSPPRTPTMRGTR